MFRRITWLLFVFMALVDTILLALKQNYSIYRVKTRHPFEEFRHDAVMVTDVRPMLLDLPLEIEAVQWQSGWKGQLYTALDVERIMCGKNYDGCSQLFKSVTAETVPPCPTGMFVPKYDGCMNNTENAIVFSKPSGEFTIGGEEYSWIIKAPAKGAIRMELTAKFNSYDYYDDYNNPFDYLTVYDAFLLRDTETSPSTRVWISTKGYLEFQVRSLPTSDAQFECMYQTGIYSLVSTTENQEMSIPPSLPGICYSVTYYSPSDTEAIPQLDWRSEKLIWKTFSVARNPKWKTLLFRGGNVPGISFSDVGSRVYSFRKCLPIEKHVLAAPDLQNYKGQCLNGGTVDSATGACLCPVGFIGQYCEEGCGSNRYGENCTQICSLLSSRCEGMIFCTNNTCSCAPGLQGESCDTTCSHGWYGASCQQECGKCKDGKPCNSYTGKCYSGCETGYYPPLCQQTYKVLLHSPRIVEIGYTHVVLSFLIDLIRGGGEPAFFEVQYRCVVDKSWSKLAPRVISNETKFNVSGLNAGKQYVMRIILIDKDGGSYQTDVPEATVTTKCIEPEQPNYYCTVQKLTTSEIPFEWDYNPGEKGLLCEFEKFELYFVAGNEKFMVPIYGKEGNKAITGLLADTEYSFQLIGETRTGKRIVAPKQVVRTLSAVPDSVRDVQVLPSGGGTKLEVSWRPPWSAAEAKLRYKVTYECVRLLSCENVSCSSSGHVEAQTNSVLLEHLKPHSLYEIKVFTMSSAGEAAEEYAVNATTAYAAPQVAPSAAENPILSVTNTSVSFKWMPPTDCTRLNGYINGYSYTLIDQETKYSLYQKSVPDNIFYGTFSDLVPRHCYEAHVALAASGGTDLRNVLVISFCTTSAAPDQVQVLEVYKRSRRMVGLRWGLPLNLYGDIESFTITYSKMGKTENKSVVIEPTFCEAWPHLYCFTATYLSPGKRYKFVVQARNKEVNTDGEPATVEAITTEGVSTPPRNLRAINSTESSVLLEWDIPDNINGQLRSFVIVTEQIDMNGDSGDSDDCCDDIPIEDYRVISEQPSYAYEVTGLSPASMYSVAVAAKTISVGEVARIMVHTLPPKPKLPQNALTREEKEDCSSKCDTISLKIRPAAGISGMNRTYILLLLSNSSKSPEEFDDIDLVPLLQSEFGNNYHIISQYTEDEVKEEPVITFGPKELGIENEELQTQKYALVVIQDYMGKKSMDSFVAEYY